MKQDEKKDLRLIKKNQGTTPVAVHTHNPGAETLKALEGNEDPELENKINDIIKIMKQYGTIVTPERPDGVTLLPKDLGKTELKTHILCINYDIKNNVFTITQNFYNGPNKDRRPPYEEVKKDGKPVMIYSEETKKNEVVKRVPSTRDITLYFNDKKRIGDTIYVKDLSFNIDRYTNEYQYNDPENNTNKAFKDIVNHYHNIIKEWIEDKDSNVG